MNIGKHESIDLKHNRKRIKRLVKDFIIDTGILEEWHYFHEKNNKY